MSKAAACARWLKAWENKENWSAEELTAVAQIVAAVGEPADVDGLAVAKQARQLLVSNASAHHVKKQVLDYVRFHRRHFGEGVDLAAAVASSSPPTSGWEQVLKTGRRAAVCASVLEKMGLGEPSYRRLQGASLFWLEQAAVQRAEKARPRHWEKTSLLSALARRQSRIQATLEKQAWTNEELMAGLVGLCHTPWWPEVRQLGFEWLIKHGNTPLVMEKACQGSVSNPSLVAQLLDGCTVSIVPLDFLNTISPWFTRAELDSSIASRLLGVGCKTVGSAWLDDIKKQAWENPFDEWEKVEVKLAAMVSQAAQAGRLDVSSVDWECLGGMKPLAVQLKQYALESSLPAASPKPRSSFRM